MSYVLDALKKADAERERGSVPGLHAQPVPLSPDLAMPRQGKPWVWTVGGAVGAGVVCLLAWRLIGHEEAAVPVVVATAPASSVGRVGATGGGSATVGSDVPGGAPVSQPVDASTAPGAAGLGGSAEGLPAGAGARHVTQGAANLPGNDAADRAAARGRRVPTAAPGTTGGGAQGTPDAATADVEQGQRHGAGAGLAGPRSTPGPVAGTRGVGQGAAGNGNTSGLSSANTSANTSGSTNNTSTNVAPAATPAVAATATAASPKPAAADNRILSMAELPADVRGGMPPLAVGGSIYSESPSGRFVIINGQIFHEGDTLANDLVLEQIRLKMAVLRYKGTRFSIAF